MKRNYIYGILIMALVALPACHRADPEDGLRQGDLIRINAVGSDLQTKAFLNGVDVQKTGIEVKIYDWLTGFTGKINDQQPEGGNVMYIDDALICTADGTSVDDGTWTWGSGTPWRWTRTGVHHFYGWLTKDKDGLENNGPNTAPTFDATNKVLSVPTITFTKATPQFDFSYSDIVPVNVENSNFNATQSVNLPLKHLFSALGVSIQNSGNDPVNILSVSLNGLKNNRSANIDFSGENTSVSLQSEGNDVQFLATLGSQKELNPGGTKIDLVTGEYIEASSLSSIYLMWPQKAEEIWAENGPEFVVNYTIDEYYSADDPTQLEVFHKELKLKDSGRFGTATDPKGIDAGHKYYLNLQFKAKAIELTLEVLPWDYTEFDLDYSSSSISANNANGIPNEGVMWLYTKSVDAGGNISWIPGNRDSREVVIDGDNEIRGIFYIGSPHNGQWQITTYPAEASQYFRVEPSTGEITSDLVFNHQGLVEFFIYPNGPVDVQQTIWVNLAFRFNGESQWRDGNTEFNRKGWHVVREP